jgi:hypothetical protein
MDAKTLLDCLPGGDENVFGWAELRFESPIGEISGNAELSFSFDKRPQLSVRVDSFSAEAPYDRFLLAFLAGTKPTEEEGRISFSVGGIERRFASLVVHTDLGDFSASTGFVWPDYLISEVQLVKAAIVDLAFTPLEHREPKYWLAALLGPFEDLTIERPADHVLALPNRWLYRFNQGTRVCAVQPLRSKTGPTDAPYDAIAFGELLVGTDVFDPSRLVPHGLVSALRFALGANVQMPCLEVRDAEGNLARRYFLSIRRNAIDANGQVFSSLHSGDLNSGFGAFLDRFFSAGDEIRTRLIIPMNLVQSGAPGNGPIEDSITDLMKALDNIVQGNGLTQQNLLTRLHPDNAERVQAIVGSAREQLKKLRERVLLAGTLDELAPLDRIIGRLNNVVTTDRDFGIAVRMLLEKLELSDAEILEKYYSSVGSTYEALLSAVRGQVIHLGHLGMMDRNQLRSWFEFARHIHDLCKRIILREIGYTGTYQPSNVAWQGMFTVGRITPEMNPSDLGFSHQPPALSMSTPS